MTNLLKIAKLLIINGLIKKFYQNILATLAFLLIGSAASVAITQTPIVEWLLQSTFNHVTKQTQPTTFWPPFSFYLFLISGISIGIYAHISNQKKGKKFIDNIQIAGDFPVRNSTIDCFLGSIENIENIDVVVTSENTDLDLGSMSGTSVSGRVRKMAASFNLEQELKIDHLKDHIDKWKKSETLGPYRKGMCVISPPFNTSVHGVKCIINAVAIEKTSGPAANIDRSAIKHIVKQCINHAIKKNYASIFIPVFGLGSGNVNQEDAIGYTVDSILNTLMKTDKTIKVYVGVYTAHDCAALMKTLAIKTLSTK